jgi:hypothetical protein
MKIIHSKVDYVAAGINIDNKPEPSLGPDTPLNQVWTTSFTHPSQHYTPPRVTSMLSQTLGVFARAAVRVLLPFFFALPLMFHPAPVWPPCALHVCVP